MPYEAPAKAYRRLARFDFDTLELPARIINILIQERLTTKKSLFKLIAGFLEKKIYGLGSKSINEIRDVIKDN